MAIQLNLLHASLFFLFIIEAEHIALLQMIILQIVKKLLLASCVVCISTPDLKLHDELFLAVVNDDACALRIAGAGFDIIISSPSRSMIR